MQREIDDLDRLIIDAFEDIEIEEKSSEDYNERILKKLHGVKENRGGLKTAAYSLIAAGFLLIFIYTSGIQYSMTNIECKIKMDVSMVKHSINLDKYFLGE